MAQNLFSLGETTALSDMETELRGDKSIERGAESLPNSLVVKDLANRRKRHLGTHRACLDSSFRQHSCSFGLRRLVL